LMGTNFEEDIFPPHHRGILVESGAD